MDPLDIPNALFRQREKYNDELKYLNYQHMRKAQEVFAKEEVIAAVIEEEGRAEQRLLNEKIDVEDALKKLDWDLSRLDKKELFAEQARIEQLDNVERKIEYERHKNSKIEDQIKEQQGKIEKFKDRYKGRFAQMHAELAEIEKDQKFAQMLMKTYVDQIAREEKKLKAQEEAKETVQELPPVHKKNQSSLTRKMTTLVTRNNEGKVCNTSGPNIKRAKTAGLKKLKSRV